MSDLQRFCEALSIDETEALGALQQDRAEITSALAMPWYARLVVGLGAWVTALVAIALGSMILFALGAEANMSLATLGFIYFGLGLWSLRRAEHHVYLTQLGVVITAAGTAMIAAGIGLESEEIFAAALVSVVLTIIIILATTQRALQFLAALLAALLCVGTLLAENVRFYLDIAALAAPVALFMMLRPPQRDVQPAATVLLLLMPLLGIFGGTATMFWQVGTAGGWFAKLLHIALFLGLVAIHWQRSDSDAARYRLGIFAAAAVIVGVLLPPGGSAALLIIMLAFVLGSRPLAVLGVLLQIHYLWRFYYDLQVTLLAKSGVLLAVGAVLLIAWWLMQRHTTIEERP